MKLVDMGVSKSPAGNGVRVRVPPAALSNAEAASYLVGVALGDGNLSSPNGRCLRLRITCDEKYPGIAAEIESSLRLLFPENRVSRVYRSDSKCFDISVYSNSLKELIPWECGRGTKIQQKAHVPDWIFETELTQKKCLKGLFQTDGCIYKDRGYDMVHFTNVSKELADDCMLMMQNLGFKPNIYLIKQPKTYKYVVRLSKDVLNFVEAIGLTKT